MSITHASPTTERNLELIGKIQEYLVARRVQKVFRVWNKILPVIQLERSQYKAKANYEVVMVKSIDEAMELI
jgi:hypothetical protein